MWPIELPAEMEFIDCILKTGIIIKYIWVNNLSDLNVTNEFENQNALISTEYTSQSVQRVLLYFPHFISVQSKKRTLG